MAAALSLALRAGASLGVIDDADVAEARALAASAGEARLPLAVALWEAGGRAPGDADAARAALRELVARVPEPAERAACRAYLTRRYAVPSELVDDRSG